MTRCIWNQGSGPGTTPVTNFESDNHNQNTHAVMASGILGLGGSGRAGDIKLVGPWS